MKKEQLSDAIEKLDKDIVEEADAKRRAAENGAAPRKTKPALAITAGFLAVAAAITGVVVIPKLGNNNIPVEGTEPAITTTTATQAPGTSAGVSTAEIFDSTEPEDRAFTRERKKTGIVSAVSAVNMIGDSVASDSALKLTLGKDISDDELREHIKLSPESEFTLSRDTDGSVLLKTAASFGKGSLVKLGVTDSDGVVRDSWAFRTADDFSVTAGYPRDGYTGVSTDSGIEIEFSSIPSLDDARAHFSVTPDVSGKFTVVENTLCFVPDDGLKPNTSYTVTIAKGYKSEDGFELSDDYKLSFRTTAYSDRGTYIFAGSSNSGFSETFLPDDRACIEIYCSNDLSSREYETHLYRFGNSDEYSEAVKSFALDKTGNLTFDTSELEEVFTSTEVPFSREGEYPAAAYVLLPEQLAEGYYIADVSVTGAKDTPYSLQYLIQVSDISVYTLSLGEENVFFVNDSATGRPAAGATVTLETSGGTYSGTADSNGLAYITTKGETGNAVVNIGAKTGRYIDSVILSDAENVKYEDTYYMYLYTDRYAYLPTDTINVWGVIRPKARGTSLPSGLYLSLDGEKQYVTPDASGTFTTAFRFRSHTDTWWSEIALMSGDDTLTSTHVSIHDYEKPTYVLSADVPEFAIMPQYTAVPVTLSAEYYEGTAADGVLIKCTDGISDPGTIKTDSAGEAFAAVLSERPNNSYEIANMSMSFEVTGVENSYTYLWKSIPVLYHDRMLTYEYDEATRTLTLFTDDLDLSCAGEFFANTKKDKWGYRTDADYDILKSGAADIPVSVKITRRWSEERETGSYYDYIEKKTVKTYTYDYKNLVVYDNTVNTVNGTAVLSGLPTDPELGTYEVEITYYDSFDQEMKENIWNLNKDYIADGIAIYDDFYGTSMYYLSSSSKLFYRLDAMTGSTDSPDGNAVYNSFTENEDITFRLACSNGDTSFPGKLLLAVYRSDLVTYRVYDLEGGRDVVYKATADCIPDARYTAAYFDGKHIFKVSGSAIQFDPKERGIKLRLSSDSETYDAGETAEISVRTTDVNGNILSGATVLLSVVDEAAFAISDQNADPLGDLYSFINYPAANSSASYIQHTATNSSAGEKGGGGGSETRKDFKDTAFFASAVTDNNGYTSFTVKLPDNMTTWRATVLAVYERDTDLILAGKELLPIVVSRPVFITPIMHSEFIVGDDVAVSAKCAGLGKDGDITVSISGNGTDETRTIKQQQTANFGKLAKGGYTVRFTAEKDGFTDAVEMPVTVTDTLLETRITAAYDLNDLSGNITPTKWPAELAFFNKGYMFSADILLDLMRYTGESLDSRLGEALAWRELGYITDEEFTEMFASETANGYARRLPAAEESRELTALIAAAAPELISDTAHISARDDAKNGSLAERCTAYMMLAALGEPVQDDVKKLSGEVKFVKSGIELSTALALCGDFNAAYELYMTFVPDITINDNDPKAVFAYIADNNGNASREYTKAALTAASILKLPEAEYFARYLMEQETEHETSSKALELAIYTLYYVPNIRDDASFTYNLNGSAETVSLEKYRPTILTFTEEQFANADFTVTSGEVYAVAGYTGRVDEHPGAPTAKINKTLSTTGPAPGEEVVVNISTAPYSMVYDVIPSCGRLSGSQSGQLIRLFTDKDGKATYSFTVSTAGEYVVESAVVHDYKNDTWGICDRTTITVGDGDVA